MADYYGVDSLGNIIDESLYDDIPVEGFTDSSKRFVDITDDEKIESSASGTSDDEGEDNGKVGSGAGRSKELNEEYGSFEPKAMTDDNFRARESELVEDTGNVTFEYANMPVAHTSNIIIDYKEILEKITSHYKSTDRRYHSENI